jgi:hypothetical protein
MVKFAALLESIPQELVKNKRYWLLFKPLVTPVNVNVFVDVPE